MIFFFDSKFNLTKLEFYFEENAWDKVKALYKTKVDHSTCIICNNLCIKSSIECTRCKKWYHYTCENIDEENIDKNESMVWLCLICTAV